MNLVSSINGVNGFTVSFNNVVTRIAEAGSLIGLGRASVAIGLMDSSPSDRLTAAGRVLIMHDTLCTPG
jgi:hypothetical protein